MFLHEHFDVLLSPFVTMTTVRISLGGDSFYLHCLVFRNMVGLRVRFGAPLTGLNTSAVFLLLTVLRRRHSVLLRCLSMLFYTVSVTLLCLLLFSRLRLVSSPLPLVFIYPPFPGLMTPSPVPFDFMSIIFNHLFVLFKFLISL
jgi:hypothetical protein